MRRSTSSGWRRAGRRALACLALAWLAAFAPAAAEPKAAPAPALNRLIARATVVMQYFEAGVFSAILDQMHHPPQDSETAVADDRRAISVALQFLATRFGRLESYELAQAPVDCFCVSLAMGRPEYWSGLPESDRGDVVTFATRHAKIQSSIVRLTETRAGGGWIRSIEIGVPTTVPEAKDQIANIARAMAERMDAATRKPKSANPPSPE